MFSTVDTTGGKDLSKIWTLLILFDANILIYTALKHSLLWSPLCPLHAEDSPLSFCELDLLACCLAAAIFRAILGRLQMRLEIGFK